MTATTSPAAHATTAATAPASTGKRGLRDLGRLPVIVALVIIAVGFQLANDAFLSSRNLSNLVMQTATLAILTLGAMLVLVLGEIDLSIGAVSGLSAAAMAIVSALHGWPAWAAMALALAIGAAIGLAQGAWIVVFGAPSFIVTLAGMLVWQGVQLWSLQSQNGQLRVTDSFITGLASTYLPSWAAWLLCVGIIALGLAALAVRRVLSTRSGYDVEPMAKEAVRAVVIVSVPVAVALALENYLGVPWLLVIVLVITGVLSLVTASTVFGRHIYAVGGNAEAAHRTGVRVNALRLVIFTVVSTLASVGGILSASRTYSVSVNTGGGSLSLNAIAAAVIGGTSLFGGRGTIVGALLGALVISSVQNGLTLVGQTTATQTITTGLILLAAVTFDMSVRGRSMRKGFR